jgi:cell division protein DivIC
MARQKLSSAVKRRLLIFGSISVFIILYFVFSVISYTYQYIDLNNKKKVLEQELILLKEKENELKIELVKLNDPEYIARYARENYLYSKDGEYIIKIEKKVIEEETEDVSDNEYTYYLIGGVSLIILALVLKRKKRSE